MVVAKLVANYRSDLKLMELLFRFFFINETVWNVCIGATTNRILKILTRIHPLQLAHGLMDPREEADVQEKHEAEWVEVELVGRTK